MSYSEVVPESALRTWVERIAATRDGSAPPPAPIRILPRSPSSLLLTWASNGLRVELVGPRTRPHFVWDQEPMDKVEVLLRPGTADRWFGGATATWIDRTANLEELGGSKMRPGLTPLEEASPEDRVGRVQAWLQAESRSFADRDPNRIDVAIDRIQGSGGRLGIANLATSLDLHERTLERRFKARTGLSPKRYSRIVRFEQAVEAMRAGRPAAEVATRGFSDQAHLSRELRHFAGASLRELGLVPASGRKTGRTDLRL